MRNFVVLVLIAGSVWVLSGCESHPVPTAGSAAQVVVPTQKTVVKQKSIL